MLFSNRFAFELQGVITKVTGQLHPSLGRSEPHFTPESRGAAMPQTQHRQAWF